MTVGEHIVRYCKEKHITYREFASKVGYVTEAYICRVIRDDIIPRPLSFMDIAIALEMEPIELVKEHYETFFEKAKNQRKKIDWSY